jgi:hypothetical protein
MSHFGNSLTTGYETLIQQRVAAWLLNTPDGKKLVEETLAKVGPVAFGNRLTGKGAVALGTAVLNFRPGDQSSNWGPLCDQEFVDQLNQLVLKDQLVELRPFQILDLFREADSNHLRQGGRGLYLVGR